MEASFSAVSSAERVAAFLAGHRGRVTVVVEAASPAGLSWLAEQTKGRELRLLVGEDSDRRWGSELSTNDRQAAASFLARHDVETRFWRPGRRRVGQGSVSVWYAEGPPAAALNASTQLTEACLHQHIDTIGTVHSDEMGYVQGWVDEAVGASWDARDSLLAHPPTSHDGAPSQSAPASRQS